MSSKKHVNLLFFYSPKLAVTQYSVMIHFLKYLNVNVIWKVITEQLNIISSEIALGDVDFPLDIKICAGYLTPISMDRAGSTAQYEYTFNSGIVANVAEVMNKRSELGDLLRESEAQQQRMDDRIAQMDAYRFNEEFYS